MTIVRYASDFANGSDSNSGLSSGPGDFTNATKYPSAAIVKAVNDFAGNGNILHLEISGGPSGLVYDDPNQLVLTPTASDYDYGGAGLFDFDDGNVSEQHEIFGSSAVGHDGQVTIDQVSMAYATFDSAVVARVSFVNFYRLRTINGGNMINDLQLQLSDGSTIHDCITEYLGHGILADRSDNAEIFNNFVLGDNSAGASSGIKIEDVDGSVPMKIYSNYLFKAGASPGGANAHFGIQIFGSPNTEITNNTVADTYTTGIALIDGASVGSTGCILRNNISVGAIDAVGNPGETGHFLGVDAASSAGLDSDFNSFNGKGYFGGTFASAVGWAGGDQSLTLAEWQTDSGGDANSVEDLPNFVGGESPSTVAGITLFDDSAQIQAGDPSVLPLNDINGVSFRNPPNMGAVANDSQFGSSRGSKVYKQGLQPKLTPNYKTRGAQGNQPGGGGKHRSPHIKVR